MPSPKGDIYNKLLPLKGQGSWHKREWNYCKRRNVRWHQGNSIFWTQRSNSIYEFLEVGTVFKRSSQARQNSIMKDGSWQETPTHSKKLLQLVADGERELVFTNGAALDVQTPSNGEHMSVDLDSINCTWWVKKIVCVGEGGWRSWVCRKRDEYNQKGIM